MKESERLHALQLAAGAIYKLPLPAEHRAWLLKQLTK